MISTYRRSEKTVLHHLQLLRKAVDVDQMGSNAFESSPVASRNALHVV